MSDSNKPFNAELAADLLDALRKVEDSHIVYKLATGQEYQLQAEKAAKNKLNEVNELVPLMINELDDPSLQYKTICSCLRSIRAELDELNNPPRPTISAVIRSKADVEPTCILLEAAFSNEHVSIDLDGMLNDILDCMSVMCAPARDVNIAQLRKFQCIAKKIGGIMITLREMGVDMANYMLCAISGTCRDNWKLYVRCKFDEILQLTQRHDINILEDTARWIRNSMTEELDDENTQKLFEMMTIQEFTNTLIRTSFVSLLCPDLLPPFPCTLEFEAKSLVDNKSIIYKHLLKKCINLILNELHLNVKQTDSSTAHSTATSELKDRMSPLEQNEAFENELDVLLSEHVARPLSDVLDDVCIQIENKIKRLNSSTLNPTSLNQLRQQIKRLPLMNDSHSIFAILLSRVKETLNRMLKCGNTAEAELTLRDSNHPEDVKKAIFQFYTGCAVNRFVFDDIYDEIALKLYNERIGKNDG